MTARGRWPIVVRNAPSGRDVEIGNGGSKIGNPKSKIGNLKSAIGNSFQCRVDALQCLLRPFQVLGGEGRRVRIAESGQVGANGTAPPTPSTPTTQPSGEITSACCGRSANNPAVPDGAAPLPSDFQCPSRLRAQFFREIGQFDRYVVRFRLEVHRRRGPQQRH